MIFQNMLPKVKTTFVKSVDVYGDQWAYDLTKDMAEAKREGMRYSGFLSFCSDERKRYATKDIWDSLSAGTPQ